MRLLMAIAIVAIITSLAGCDFGGQACTDLAAASVTLVVIDETGAAITDADASYSVDGADSQPCETFDSTSYVCGWEASGSIEVTVTKAGYQDAVETVEVGADECHVIGETLEITLQPE